MASIWLQYGFDMAFKEVIWELSGDILRIFKELMICVFLKKLTILDFVLSPFVKLQLKSGFLTKPLLFFYPTGKQTFSTKANKMYLVTSSF